MITSLIPLIAIASSAKVAFVESPTLFQSQLTEQAATVARRNLRVNVEPNYTMVYDCENVIEAKGMPEAAYLSAKYVLTVKAKKILPDSIVWEVKFSDLVQGKVGWPGQSSPFDDFDNMVMERKADRLNNSIQISMEGISVPSVNSSEISFPGIPLKLGESWTKKIASVGMASSIRYTLADLVEENGVKLIKIQGDYIPNETLIPGKEPVEVLLDAETNTMLKFRSEFSVRINATGSLKVAASMVERRLKLKSGQN